MMRSNKSNWKWNLLVIGLAVAATSATASAQEVKMRTTVPFAFSINQSANLPSGSYVVARHGDVWSFRSEETGQSVAIVNTISLPARADGSPRLSFACVNSHCQVAAIHLGRYGSGVQITAPKLNKSEAGEIAEVSVPLGPSQGE